LTQAQYDWASMFCGINLGLPAAASAGAAKPKSGPSAPDPKAVRAAAAAKNVNDASDADIAKLFINPGANKTFTDAMDTIVHETSHAYQHDLVE
jgi:hypothetical protein